MLLSQRITIKITDEQSVVIGHLCYAAQKLWNIGNYEKRNYTELGFEKYPNWYEQKKRLKTNMWFKNLPSQTAQETLNILEQGWKSFFKLRKTGGIKNPKPPRFKSEPICVTYMQNGIKHEPGSSLVSLTIPKQLKQHLAEKYNIHSNFLTLENNLFSKMDIIKQVKIYPPINGSVDIIAIYEIPDVLSLINNGKYLSIDLGIKNGMTCYNNTDNKVEILARNYVEISRYYDKQIAYYQAISDAQQAAMGIKYPKKSKRVLKLYEKKRNALNDLFHKCTRYVSDECVNKGINTVVIGDIKHIRDNKTLGNTTNQVFHSLPYAQIYQMLEYKLAQSGINFVKVKESYSSQCSPLSPSVSKKYAKKNNRKHRGLYVDGQHIWNADGVGTYNILRLYLQQTCLDAEMLPTHLSNPKIVYFDNHKLNASA